MKLLLPHCGHLAVPGLTRESTKGAPPPSHRTLGSDAKCEAVPAGRAEQIYPNALMDPKH